MSNFSPPCETSPHVHISKRLTNYQRETLGGYRYLDKAILEDETPKNKQIRIKIKNIISKVEGDGREFQVWSENSGEWVELTDRDLIAKFVKRRYKSLTRQQRMAG